jgi:hypothetical protein
MPLSETGKCLRVVGDGAHRCISVNTSGKGIKKEAGKPSFTTYLDIASRCICQRIVLRFDLGIKV